MYEKITYFFNNMANFVDTEVATWCVNKLKENKDIIKPFLVEYILSRCKLHRPPTMY